MTPQEWSPQAVIELALADVQRRKAGWTQADLTQAINDALPDYLGVPDGADVGELLDTPHRARRLRVADSLDKARPGDALLPAELRLDNGDSSYVAPGSTAVRDAGARAHRARTGRRDRGRRGRRAAARDGAAGSSTELRESGIELGVDQAAAVHGVLTSGARVETLVGPAGTGKSFVVGAIARGWTDPAAARATGAAAGVRARDLADRHRRPGRRGPDRPQRRPLARHPSTGSPPDPAPATRSRSTATRRGGCTPGTWSWSTSPP